MEEDIDVMSDDHIDVVMKEWDLDTLKGKSISVTLKKNRIFNPKPKECIRCFSRNILIEKEFDSWRCTCNACGHEWDERFSTKRPGITKA